MELHILFFILAGLLILVLVGSSIWSNRREKSRVFSNTFANRPPSTPIASQNANEVNSSTEPKPAFTTDLATQVEEVNSPVEIQEEVNNTLSGIKIKLAGQEEAPVQSQSEPVFYGQQPQPMFTESAEPNRASPFSAMPSQEPVREYEETIAPMVQLQEPEPMLEPAEPVETVPSDILTLYVVAAEGYQFQGEYVVQCLEALGFQYGEYQIFHRHQHMGNTSSPVIFSVANMMQPGVFDLTRVSELNTVGLVMFMHLPTEGNPVANLKLMLQSAERLAQSLGGFVLNEHREIFDETSRQEYLARVR